MDGPNGCHTVWHVVWPRNLTKIPDQHTDEIISIFFFFWQSLCDLAVPNQPFSRWWAQGPGPQRMTVRSAEEERKVWSWGCHRHWITLSQCSPAIVWGRGFVRSPLVKNRYISHVLLLSLLLIDWLIFFLPWRSLTTILLSYEPVRRWWAPGEKRTDRMSLPWGRYVCTMRPPLMSYNMQVLSSWPVANKRPLGSTATEATALPVWEEP